MKKIISVLMICLSLNFNALKDENPQITSNILKEDVYSVKDIVEGLGDVRYIQNISSENSLYFILLDENRVVIEAIKMKPNSRKFGLIEFQPNYKLVLLGDGEAFLSK